MVRAQLGYYIHFLSSHLRKVTEEAQTREIQAKQIYKKLTNEWKRQKKKCFKVTQIFETAPWGDTFGIKCVLKENQTANHQLTMAVLTKLERLKD